MESRLVCIDSSIFIEHFRKKNKEGTLFSHLINSNHKLATTSITQFEIYFGSEDYQISYWDLVFERLTILNFDEDSAKIAANLNIHLKSVSKAIGIPDLFIASIALNNEVPLATLNIKHFKRIPGLEIFIPQNMNYPK